MYIRDAQHCLSFSLDAHGIRCFCMGDIILIQFVLKLFFIEEISSFTA